MKVRKSGTVYSGSPREILSLIGSESRFTEGKSLVKYRFEIIRRFWRWERKIVNPFSSREILYALEWVGELEVIR